MKKPVTLILILVLFGVGCYELGRRAASASVTTGKTDTHQTEQAHTVETIVKSPDGTIKTTIVSDVKTDTKKQEVIKQVIAAKPALNISVLALYDSSRVNKVNFGVSVSKEVIGSFTAGLFAYQSGNLGVSVGYNF